MTSNQDDQNEHRVVEMMLGFYRSDRKWIWLRRMGIAISFTFFLGAFFWQFINANGRMPIFGHYAAVIPIKGTIADGAQASASKVIPALRNAFEDPNAKAVILEIDSPGGSPLEAERIYTELGHLRRLHPKPVTAVVDNLGASAAYMIAIRADKVVAGTYSLVGSIGIIMKSYNVKELADKAHVSQLTFATGPLKAFLDPLNSPSKQEIEKAQHLVETAGSYFKAEVRERRGQRLKTNDFFSGEIWTGPEALKLGLIDEIGTMESVADNYKLKTANLSPVPGLLAEDSSIVDVLAASIAKALRATLSAPASME